ncbi:uncharacterized protein [Pagrus major]|uniref:uncharacterized protein n=1 Tax=Pagrus major TaxID=143350 RepID=UPI003CC8CBE6
MQLLRLAWALTAAAVCFVLLLLLHNEILREGQLAAGTCEIVTLDRDSSQPRRTIARQTARCACRKGQIAGTTRARPACVDVRIVWSRQWCEMSPCLDDEGCDLLVNQSGWTCTQPGGRVKTTTEKVTNKLDCGTLRTEGLPTVLCSLRSPDSGGKDRRSPEKDWFPSPIAHHHQAENPPPPQQLLMTNHQPPSERGVGTPSLMLG